MNVRIKPAAPTIDPAIIKTVLPTTNPVNAAAIPDNEFNNETTTGISAPPIGKTNKIPRTHDSNTIPIISPTLPGLFRDKIIIIIPKINNNDLT